jgi:hypothetical protein
VLWGDQSGGGAGSDGGGANVIYYAGVVADQHDPGTRHAPFSPNNVDETGECRAVTSADLTRAS